MSRTIRNRVPAWIRLVVIAPDEDAAAGLRELCPFLPVLKPDDDAGETLAELVAETAKRFWSIPVRVLLDRPAQRQIGEYRALLGGGVPWFPPGSAYSWAEAFANMHPDEAQVLIEKMI